MSFNLFPLPYKEYVALLTQTGAGGTTSTSGTLEVGKQYEITDYNSGDDFTNVGAASNAGGVYFVATGTTPAVWTNGSTLTETGAPVATVLQNTLGGIPTRWYASTGSYDFVLEGAFAGVPVLMESVVFNENTGVLNAIKGIKIDDDRFQIATFAAADLTTRANDVLSSTLVNIVVFP